MKNLSSSEDQTIQKTSTSTENVADEPKPFPVVNISPGVFGEYECIYLLQGICFDFGFAVAHFSVLIEILNSYPPIRLKKTQ